jgi:hypothetical protein
MTIGIVVQDISSPFFDETLRGVDDGLKNTGYASVIVSGHWMPRKKPTVSVCCWRARSTASSCCRAACRTRRC